MKDHRPESTKEESPCQAFEQKQDYQLKRLASQNPPVHPHNLKKWEEARTATLRSLAPAGPKIPRMRQFEAKEPPIH